MIGAPPLGRRQDHETYLKDIEMAVITTAGAHKFPWYVRLFFWNQKRRYGAILEPARLWGRTPKVFASLALLYGALDRRSSPIEPALRTLITVRVSQINWCSFCVDVNAATALRRDVAEVKLLAIADFSESRLFSASLLVEPSPTRISNQRRLFFGKGRWFCIAAIFHPTGIFKVHW